VSFLLRWIVPIQHGDTILEIEWTDTDPDTGERRFVCATKFARQWGFKVRFKRRTNWEPAPFMTREMWETLLDGLERRYWRREGVSEEDIAGVKKVLASLSPPPEFDEANSTLNDE
jgi:hypothetical protein